MSSLRVPAAFGMCVLALTLVLSPCVNARSASGADGPNDVDRATMETLGKEILARLDTAKTLGQIEPTCKLDSNASRLP